MFFSSYDLVIVVLIVLLVRYFVWRGRYKKTNARLDNLSNRLTEVSEDLHRLTAIVANLGAADSAGVADNAPHRPATHTRADALAAPVTRPDLERIDDKARQLARTVPQSAGVAGKTPHGPATRATTDMPAVSATAANLERVDEKARQLAQSVFPPAHSPTPSAPGVLTRIGSSIRAALARHGGGVELEALIGGNWLNKIGVAALVIGMALLSRYTLQYVGPAGKIALGIAVSAALLAAGVWLERLRRYTLFARPLIGGGWALLYFTAYAAHNFEASKIIADPTAGLIVMLIVAAGMVGHSLRYRSEMVSGAAYVLGFIAIDINPLGLYSLLANAFLGASLVALLSRFDWYRLTLGGVIATYFTHVLWLSGASTENVAPAAFWAAQGMLILYWAIFSTVEFLRDPASETNRQYLFATTLLNALSFTALSFLLVDAVYPDNFHLFVDALAGGAIAMSALLAWRGRRQSHIFYGLYAAAFALVAIPLFIGQVSLPGEWLAIGWSGLAAALLAAGLWRREIAFRAAAYLAGIAASAAALGLNVFGHAEVPLPPVGGDNLLRWSTLLVVAVALLASEWLLSRTATRTVQIEKQIGIVAGYVAVVLLAALFFEDVAQAYLSLCWLAAGIVAFEIGLRIGYIHSRFRGYGLILAGFIALLINNANLILPAADSLQPHLRIMVFAVAAAGLFGHAWRIKYAGEKVTANESALYPITMHAGALTLALLAWNEVPIAAVALAWAFLALVFYQAGVRLREPALRVEAYALAISAWGRLFIVDFVAIGDVAGVSTRVLSVIPIVALLYFFRSALSEKPRDGVLTKLASQLPVFFSFAATFAVFVMVRFEFGRADAVTLWAVLALVLFAIGIRFGSWDFRIQAYLVAASAFVRSWTTNFYLTGDFYGVPERIATTVPVIVALFAIGLLWRRRRTELAAAIAAKLPRPIGLLDAYSTQINSGLAVALTALLLLYTVSGDLLTISWAAEGLIVTAAGFAIRERTLRLSGLGILAICLVKGFVIDLQGVDPIYRIVSFIILGAILLSISFAYTRYRHVVKTYI